MTYLLKLLKYYKPAANYDCLPRTGQELLKIDCRDWLNGSNNTRSLPKPTELGEGGKYIHFGLERASNCDSRGVLHKDTEKIHHCYRFQSEKRYIS